MSPVIEATTSRRRPIIVCPLEFERTSLRRAGLDRWAELSCSGPGQSRIRQWWTARTIIDAPVILAGVAGSLHDDFEAGSAWWISQIVHPPATAPLVPSLFTPTTRCIVTCPNAAACDPAEKSRLRDHTGADLVDLESLTFAEHAIRAGAKWAIVRGVSDGAKSSLPRGIGQWVNDHGRTRAWRVLADLAKRPADIRLVHELNTNGRLAMAGVAALLQQFGKPALPPNDSS